MSNDTLTCLQQAVSLSCHTSSTSEYLHKDIRKEEQFTWFTLLTMFTLFILLKLLYTATTLACMPVYIVREG